MYEFIGHFNFQGNVDIGIGELLKNNYSYLSCDNCLEFHEPNITVKGYSRRDIEKVYYHDGQNYCFLIGEAYASMQDSENRSLFLTAADIYHKYHANNQSFKSLKGDFIFILFVSSDRIEIISSIFSILTLYYYYQDNNLVVSTNLMELIKSAKLKLEINYTALIEQQLFYFPVWDHTMIRSVFRVLPARKISFSAGNLIKQQTYFDFRNLYFQDKLRENQAVEQFAELFFNVTNGLAGGSKKINVALTAGFDSRVIFSVLENGRYDIQCYAFGPKGMDNIEIPLEISKKIGFKFLPIWLGEKFEDNFPSLYRHCTLLTDGYLGERCNYTFAYAYLCQHSNITLNGNWGSEAMRPFQNFGYLVSRDFVDISISKSKRKKFDDIYSQYKSQAYFRGDFVEDSREEIWAHLTEWFNYIASLEQKQQIHSYIYFNNEVKYFANEIQSERLYCTNRYPFHDFDIVKCLFSSPFSGFNKDAFRKNYYSLYKSQKIYYEIIKRFKPELLQFTTDHGYAPIYFRNQLGIINISLGYVTRSIKNKLRINTGFRNLILAKSYYKNIINELISDNILKDSLSDNLYLGFNDLCRGVNLWRLGLIMSHLLFFKEYTKTFKND